MKKIVKLSPCLECNRHRYCQNKPGTCLKFSSWFEVSWETLQKHYRSAQKKVDEVTTLAGNDVGK